MDSKASGVLWWDGKGMGVGISGGDDSLIMLYMLCMLWKEADCPSVRWVAVNRCIARANCHRAGKQVEKNRDIILRSRIAGLISDRKLCYFWKLKC